MASMRNVTSVEDYDEVVANAGSECIVVEFWSDNMPVIEGVLNSGENAFTNCTFVSVNMGADETKGISEKLNVSSAPTLLILKGGQEVARLENSYDEEAIKAALAQHCGGSE